MGAAVMVRQALVSMGYMEGRPGKWVKPVGFHAFGFHEETSTWTHYYKSLDLHGAKPGEWIKGGVEVWESKVLKTDEDSGGPLYQLKAFEAYTWNCSSGSTASEFEIAVR